MIKVTNVFFIGIAILSIIAGGYLFYNSREILDLSGVFIGILLLWFSLIKRNEDSSPESN